MYWFKVYVRALFADESVFMTFSIYFDYLAAITRFSKLSDSDFSLILILISNNS